METQEFKDKVTKVGEILKMQIEFATDEDMHWNKRAYLIQDQRKIGIVNGDYQGKDKFHIFGVFPTTKKDGQRTYYGGDISINVSDTKTPEQIARDIERRFLPAYLPALEQSITQVLKANTYDQKRQANIQKMADYLGVEVRENLIYVYNKNKGLNSTIKAYGEDTVNFELEVTPEMAIKIFDLLKKEV